MSCISWTHEMLYCSKLDAEWCWWTFPQPFLIQSLVLLIQSLGHHYLKNILLCETSFRSSSLHYFICPVSGLMSAPDEMNVAFRMKHWVLEDIKLRKFDQFFWVPGNLYSSLLNTAGGNSLALGRGDCAIDFRGRCRINSRLLTWVPRVALWVNV